MSRFFSVTIDELISPDEVVSAAQAERRSFALGYASLVCGLLDVSMALLLVVPVIGNGTEGPTTVSLLALTGVSPWVRAIFSACVGATVLCWFCELAASLAVGVVGHGLDDETERQPHRHVVGLLGLVLEQPGSRRPVLRPGFRSRLNGREQASLVLRLGLFSSPYNARFTPVLAFSTSLSQR